MNTIRAAVNPRLLTKVNRLVTGCRSGRIIEILQNARRAGATEIQITNQAGLVTVHDNGRGVEDFSKLLDLGGSGWDSATEVSEDPCGVGLFCLVPRAVTIRSSSQRVTIARDAWSGEAVPVEVDPEPITGTLLQFRDEPWDFDAVALHAVFCGMQVLVDGKPCPREAFTSPAAVHHPELGCRIEIRRSKDLDQWHRRWLQQTSGCGSGLVNFHGQVVPLRFEQIRDHDLHYLVDMTGEPTGIRLMLPARTRLVENAGHTHLLDMLEREAFQFIRRQGSHNLPFRGFERARELGIELPEATPRFWYGLLSGDSPPPATVPVPEGLPLASCYRMDDDWPGGCENDSTNAHLLAALGGTTEPFVPVHINTDFHGYSWADLPLIQQVKLTAGATRHQADLWGYSVTCVDRLEVAVETSDGKAFAGRVPIAVDPSDENHIYVTAEAEHALRSDELWYHFGGWCEDDDTYATQRDRFEQDLEVFWAALVGPDEYVRRQVRDLLLVHVKPAWHEVKVSADGRIEILHQDGTTRSILPPEALRE